MSFIKKEPGTQYGLVLSKKLNAPKAGNVFGDNLSEDEDGTDWVKKSLKNENEKNQLKRTKFTVKKALEEDPTIYQYDEIYDEIEKVKEEAKPVKVIKKKAKYIGNLLKAAEQRKLEQEFRIERTVQKEREEEGEKYADKECLITSSYRAKLEEFKKLKEEDERMDRLEAIADVTKQNDMTGFYRHLYRQTVENKNTDKSETVEQNNAKTVNLTDTSSNLDKDNSSSDSASEESNTSNHNCTTSSKPSTSKKSTTARHYRKRVMQASESESEEEVKKPKIISTSEIKSTKMSPNRNELPQEKSSEERKDIKIQDENSKAEIEKKLDNDCHISNGTSLDEKENFIIPEIKPEKKKVDIWKKRTVGPVFEAALQRYQERKAIKLLEV